MRLPLRGAAHDRRRRVENRQREHEQRDDELIAIAVLLAPMIETVAKT